MIKTIGMVLLAALAGSGIAYADGKVLSVVSPPADEVTGPAKPTPKVAAKKTGSKAAKKTTPKAAKKTKRKVAPPAGKGAALLQPAGSKASKRAKAAAPPASAEHAVAQPAKEAGQKSASEKHAPEMAAPAVKSIVPGPVYVQFQSNPANAEVVIDGYYAGSTPLHLPVKAGDHQLRVIYPGYEEWEHKVNAYKGMRVNALLVEKKKVTAAP